MSQPTMTDGAPNTGLENNSIPRPASETDADQDTCRICSAPGEPDQPLFHPCKCSGTIRYIHQDCLTTWLSHSKKKTCDVCKYPYSFTKVYADDMPGQLPVVLLLRKFAQQVAFAIIFCIRAVIVSFVWLAVLPWVTVWTWRMYFAMGNSTAWWISARPRSPLSSSSSFFSYNLTIRSQANATATNATLPRPANDSDAPSLNALFAHPLLRTVSADIFTGQIIATLIVLVFIAVFLLREWISQNARPGIFEEGDPAIAAEREAEQERERERERQQQRLREQARVAMERDIQLRRRQQVDAERMRRARESNSLPSDPSRRHPDRPIKDLPSRPPSRRAQEPRSIQRPQTVQLDHVASLSSAAGPSSPVIESSKSDCDPTYVQARQERLLAAEKRQLFSIANDSSGETQGPGSQADDALQSSQARALDTDPFVGGKGKAKATDSEGAIHQGTSTSSTSNPSSILAALRQKRVDWGIPGAESWTLYDFERFEMTRFNIDLMFSPYGIVAEGDPWQLIIQSEADRQMAQDRPTSYTRTARFTHRITAPDDWTECLGHITDDAWRWRARRRVLWERLREEAERDGLGLLQLPRELSSISLEGLYEGHDRDGVWTPPPAPRLISRLPALNTLSSTPSGPSDTDDGLSLLSAHKRLRAEGSRAERSFTISAMPIASPHEDDGTSRRVRQRTRSQTDAKSFSFPPAGEVADNHVFSYTPPRPLPFPITPAMSTQFASQVTSSRSAESPSSHDHAPLPPCSLPNSRLPHLQLPATTPAISVPRRPPMPSTTIPTPTSSQPSLLLRSVDSTPPASPNLATYQPPEEFQEGSVRGGYFDDFEKVNEDVDRDSEEVDPRKFERDMAQFFKEEPLAAQPPDQKIGPDAEEEEEEEEEGDLPGLLVDSDEDGEEDAREPQAAAQRGPRRVAWGPEWGDAGRADVADGQGVVAEADEDGEDAEGEDADDAALAAQLADEDIAVEDDMEGALEAIGMRGPLYVVAQNAALMIFVLDTAVGLGVWLPFTFGKSTALLSLDARRALQVLHWPIRVIRIVTDPVVDTIFFLMSVLVLPSITRLLGGSLNTVQWALSGIVPTNALEKSTHFAIAMWKSIVNFPWDRVNDYVISLSSKLVSGQRSETSSVIDRILESNHPAVKAAEHYLEVLGKQVRINSYQVATSWTRMALGDGTGERVFAIVLGYAVIGLLIAFYLNVFTVGTVRSAGRAVRSAVRQQLLVVKVAAFIIIELVLFPLGCGINLDLCSIWLFPEASLQSRIAFFQYAPLTATFYHWVVGTMFMYQFAILLASCRTIMRPGAMWFIKDPSDQNFHPIRDILERPALVQLRKLSVSAIMYGLVVACGVGSIGGLMCFGRGIILPLRWKPREPLSDVPIDLLFLHVLLPYTLRFFRPRRVVRKTSVKIWKFLCAQLRLTSYMFGGRHPDEERGVSYGGWWAPGDKVAEGAPHFHGSYRRVPNSDNVAVPRDMRATARVDVTGLPVDDEAQRLIMAQDAEAEKAKRNPKDDYTVVYIPPHFQYRVALFILALWVVGCVFITATVSMPILLGRGIFNLFTRRQMHDGYSFLVGSYALWGCWVVGHTLDRMEKRRQRRGADEARGNWPLYFLKRSVLWLAKISYIVFFIGIVIPALIGLVVELYMIMPIRLSLNPDLVPNIRVADMWALGIIYAKIILHAQRLRPLNRITAGFNHIKAHGWTNPEPLSATVEFIVPLLVGLGGMLALPPVIVVLLRHFIPLRVDQRFIFMHVYPGIFAAAGLIRLGVTGSRALSRWSQSIRDTEFLVEMRLRNYEQEKEEEKIKEKEKVEAMLM